MLPISSNLLENPHNYFSTVKGFILSPVENFANLVHFECTNPDLNDFFHNESSLYKKELLAETYTLKHKNEKKIIALVSLSNDSIRLETNKQKRKIPNSKRKSFFPSILISRLGVDKNFANNNIGSYLLSMIKEIFILNNRTGCRFITVDAYNRKEDEGKVVNFYKKNNFEILREKDLIENKKTIRMYFDLIEYIKV